MQNNTPIDKRNIVVKLSSEIKCTSFAHLDRFPTLHGTRAYLIPTLIADCNSTDMEMLKVMIWRGEIVGYKLEISIIDKIANIRK